jgi:hypothetical protein
MQAWQIPGEHLYLILHPNFTQIPSDDWRTWHKAISRSIRDLRYSVDCR